MRGRTHAALGVTSSLGISYLCHTINPDMTVELGLFTLAAWCGSFLPDIDLPTSKLARNLPRTARCIRKYISMTGYLFGDAQYQSTLNSHRGICHSFSACCSVLIALSWLMLANSSAVFFLTGIIWGMLLHILTDAFTSMGCMLLAPFSVKHYFKKENSYVLIKNYRTLFLYLIIFFLNIAICLHMVLSALFLFTEVCSLFPAFESWDIFVHLYSIGFILLQIPLRYLRKILHKFILKKHYSKSNTCLSPNANNIDLPSIKEASLSNSNNLYIKPTYPLTEKEILAAGLIGRFIIHEKSQIGECASQKDLYYQCVNLNTENVTSVKLFPESHLTDFKYLGNAIFTLSDGRQIIGSICFEYIPCLEKISDYHNSLLSQGITWVPSGHSTGKEVDVKYVE